MDLIRKIFNFPKFNYWNAKLFSTWRSSFKAIFLFLCKSNAVVINCWNKQYLSIECLTTELTPDSCLGKKRWPWEKMVFSTEIPLSPSYSIIVSKWYFFSFLGHQVHKIPVELSGLLGVEATILFHKVKTRLLLLNYKVSCLDNN